MRYIGNKTKLLNEIDILLNEKDLKHRGLVFCDLFSGTATVSNQYNGFYRIIANDILDFSFQYSKGLLLGKKVKFNNLGFNPFEYFENSDTQNYVTGFCYNNFSPNGSAQYFSDENAKYIDFIRDKIDEWYNDQLINDIEKAYLILCLLEAISKVSNVAGVYSAYLKIWDSRALKKMQFLPVEVKNTRYKNNVFCKDSNDLIKDIQGDILYIDPPYTPTQYNSQYHVLETICRNDNPETHGVGKHRDNDRMSKWCKKGSVEYEFEELIKNANFEHIIFSYSDKGIMSLSFIESVLKRYAVQGTYTFKKISFYKYKSTRAVNKENRDNTKNDEHYEYLFYIRKSNDVKYASPLNYIGGKYEALDLIKNNLPNNIIDCYDLFGGGGTVGININCETLIYNDINNYVTELLEYLATTHPVRVYNEIQKYIKLYGLEKKNKDAYTKLRHDYNQHKSPILLYLLVCFGFEHQIRYNSKTEFNNPCGNSGFNDVMYEKMISYYMVCQDKNVIFTSKSFDEYIDDIEIGDFVYLDPPYLGNDGVYQDGKRGFDGWNKDHEQKMYDFILELDRRGVHFMLSNYRTHHQHGNDQTRANGMLTQFVEENGFRVIEDNKITKRNRTERKEIIIVNY